MKTVAHKFDARRHARVAVENRKLKRLVAQDFVERAASGRPLLEHVEDDHAAADLADTAGAGEPKPTGRRPAPAAVVEAAPPPFGITGYQPSGHPEGHPTEQAVSIDWLRLVGPDAHLPAVMRACRRRWGPELPTVARWRYRQACRWDNGPLVMWDHSTGTCCIDLSGTALGAFEPAELREFARAAYAAGGHCTRVDVAIDYAPAEYSESVGLVERVTESCQAGEMLGARVFDIYRQQDSRRGLTNNGVTVGQRGSKNGSGRFLRVYDKGLQTRSQPPGKWERWEAEFSGEVANVVACRLLVDGGDDDAGVLDLARRLSLAVVEFRSGEGRRDRRDLSSWYAKLADGRAAEFIRRTRPVQSIERTATWVRQQVAPKLVAIAQRSGRDLARVFEDLAGGATASLAACVDLLAGQYADRHVPALAGQPDCRQRFNAWLDERLASSDNARRDWDASDFWEHNRAMIARAAAATAAAVMPKPPRWAGVVGIDLSAVDDLPF